jgi:ABC-2 type transport system ATP-binding protein
VSTQPGRGPRLAGHVASFGIDDTKLAVAVFIVFPGPEAKIAVALSAQLPPRRRSCRTNATPMPPLIRLDRLTKDYGSFRALDRVSLEIGPGVTGLLGPNGAGKSTLIKVLLGLVKITSGTGEVLGYELGRQARQIRSVVGYMPEDDCYLGGLTGVEMAQFMARLSRIPAIEALRRSHEILDFCGAGQERYRNVETYSTGMRQKLRFAQAIVHDPPLLILDEPTAGLDPEERTAMLNRIRILARKHGKAVLLCTHILPDVQAICDAVVILARGRVRVSERLEVLSRPAAPAFHLRVLGDGGPLVERIQGAGVDVRVADDGLITVGSNDAELQQRVWQWAREREVSIRSFAPARNSLEQIFLDAVREDGSRETAGDGRFEAAAAAGFHLNEVGGDARADS